MKHRGKKGGGGRGGFGNRWKNKFKKKAKPEAPPKPPSPVIINERGAMGYLETGKAGKRNAKEANKDLVRGFLDLSEHYEAEKDIGRSLTYCKVSKLIAAFTEPIRKSKQLEGMKGIGKGSLAKIDEYLTMGRFASMPTEKKKVNSKSKK